MIYIDLLYIDLSVFLVLVGKSVLHAHAHAPDGVGRTFSINQPQSVALASQWPSVQPPADSIHWSSQGFHGQEGKRRDRLFL